MALRSLLAFCFWLALSVFASAETVSVKYRSDVPLDTFQCATIDRSSLVERICYDAGQQYLLKGTYYHYCEIGQSTVDELLGAESMGRYFNANIWGSGSGGLFDCRMHQVPKY